MKANVIPLEPEKCYHLYNRGIDGTDLFKEARNYELFLRKYFEYAPNIAHTYCYCLLKNHFHFLIRIKTEAEIREIFHYKSNETIDKIVSKQFAHLFNGYAQIINHSYNRTGGLFESPFRRILVDTDHYFTEMVYYIHHNPQKHGFIDDFREYPYSSYPLYVNSIDNPDIDKSTVLDWFGGLEKFKEYHHTRQKSQIDNENKYTFEMD
jgi:putative transposase